MQNYSQGSRPSYDKYQCVFREGHLFLHGTVRQEVSTLHPLRNGLQLKYPA